MSFAVRNDGRGFWSVSGPDEVGADQWYSAELPSETRPSTEELIQLAIEKKLRLLASAALHVAPLQDAIDTDRASNDEVALLALWKRYRIDLGRIHQQTGFPIEIEWPLPPDEERMEPLTK
ncbi:tail fiber assembly protein [Pseudomonas sp. BIGb0164]|uniref:tail fiber assembly protein n=1 Tax=Pseudomonas sp. BIGb0164 TaxID=2940605 RepID=UPI002167A983|nr:tail fiber assembly protein [Pseudomonas sp. BIGb0164]MCS4246784.1 hypothetical protein [Pseudomonas sp. BIGb0164]